MKKIAQIKNNANGITLIALVVTIIILLILASVSITVVFGDNGLIELAKKARDAVNEAVKKEEEEIDSLLDNLNNSGKNFYIWVVDDHRLPIEGATIEIYSDQACEQKIEEINMNETGFYDHSSKILEKGTYYVKETKAPEGFNEIEGPLEFEITGKTKEEWIIINEGGAPATAPDGMILLRSEQFGNQWSVTPYYDYVDDLGDGLSVDITSYKIASTKMDSYMQSTEKFNGFKFSKYDYYTMLDEANKFILNNKIEPDEVFKEISTNGRCFYT